MHRTAGHLLRLVVRRQLACSQVNHHRSPLWHQRRIHYCRSIRRSPEPQEVELHGGLRRKGRQGNRIQGGVRQGSTSRPILQRSSQFRLELGTSKQPATSAARLDLSAPVLKRQSRECPVRSSPETRQGQAASLRRASAVEVSNVGPHHVEMRAAHAVTALAHRRAKLHHQTRTLQEFLQ